MRAAVLSAGRIQEFDLPDPARLLPGQLLVAVACCGICGSDLTAARNTATFVEVARSGDFLLSQFDPDRPVVLGHEYGGTVVETGPNVTRFSPGDRVTGIGVATAADGVPTIVGYSNDYNGGFAERLVVDAAWARPIPDGIGFEAASLAEPLHVGETHLQEAGVESTDVAVVVGTGPIGLGVVAALAHRGCPFILVVEPSPKRRSLAAQLRRRRYVCA